MKTLLPRFLILLLGMSYFLNSNAWAQAVPEMMYYKFDSPGTTVQNFASTPVGTNPATISGATIGSTGQFGTALLGNGGASATNSVGTGWNLNLAGAWTMSMWISGVTNTVTSNYLFGSAGGSTFRALTGTGVVAGGGNLEIRGTGMTDVFANNIFDATGTPVVVHFVYNPTVPDIKVYVNGVFNNAVAQPNNLVLTGTSEFQVGGYSTNNGIPTGGKMDEFRLYNRALSAAEIQTTWNQILPYAVGPNDGGVTAITSPGSPVAPGNQPVTVTIKNYGTSPLTSAQIGWKVGSVSGTTYPWSGNLATNATSAPITLGTFNFPSGNHTVKAWVANPNGVTDGNHYNDTLAISIVACNTISGTYTIDKNSLPSATNYTSFASALQALNSCGVNGAVTFNVAPNTGPYTEQVALNNINGTSATNTITFNGNGNILRGTSAAGDPVIKLEGAKWIRFNNLNVQAEATATAGQVVSLLNAANNNIFSNNTFTHSTTTASTSQVVYVYTGSSNNTFQNNTLNGAYYGIYNYGASALPNVNNQFIGNILKDQYYYGVYSYYTTGSVYEGNDISRPTRTNATTMYGMNLATSNTGLTVSKNRLHNTHDMATTTSGTVYGIYISSPGTSGNENIIKNNAIYNVNNTGGTFYAFYNSGGNNTYYFHNTISADMPSVNYSTLRGMYFASASTNVKFQNNSISLSSTATGKHAIYLGSATIALTSNGNNLYAPNGNVGYFSGDKATLADWKAANSSAYDQASVSADPQFVNLATGDLKPINSTINDIGVALTPAVTDDITGAVRSTTTPDPGAYEFVPSAFDAGITSITSPTSPVTPNASLPVIVTFKNYGLTTLTTAVITWSVNGVAQTSYNWTGSLANNQTSSALTIGSYAFPAGTHTLQVCVTTVNGQPNANAGNDCQTVTLISCNALAGAYNINKNNPASATNFISFASAVNTMNSCGISSAVTFNVFAGSGPYNETVEIMNIPGASATNTITFNGNANVLTSPTASADAVVKLNGAKWVRFNNLKIEANTGTTAGTVITLVNAADNNIFSGCNFTHSTTTTSTSQALYIYTGSSNNTFQNNTITGAYYGIYNYGSTTVPNANNQFIGNTVKDMYYYGIYSYYTTGSLYQGNDISRPTRVNATTMYGIYISTGNTTFTVSKNRIHNTNDVSTSLTGTVYGIYTSSPGTVGSENIIKNNAIYNLNNTSGYIYALYNSGGNNTYYYHNTVSADVPSAAYNTVRGMYFTAASTNVKFQNNNISLGGTATTKHAIYLGSATIALVSNYNNLYAPNGNVGYLGGAMVTLADWKLAASGAYDQNSVSADPQFVNQATGDLRPSVVALNNFGTPVTPAVSDDITGAPRSLTTPDIGAFEFSVNPNDVGIIKVYGPSTTGCGLSSSETIKVTIKNFGSNTQTTIPVSYKVNGTALATPENWTGSLAPNDTVTYSFVTKANLSASMAYLIVGQSILGSDSDASNNTDTLRVTNSMIPGVPVQFDFETAATGLSRFRTEIRSKSNIIESTGASNPAIPGSTKGIIMDGVANTNWITPVGVTDPWVNNLENFSGAYICLPPFSSSIPNDSLILTLNLKQLFKQANANTNFRVTVNGQQVGPTYRPPFDPTNPATPIAWRMIRINLSALATGSSMMIGLESSVKEAYANGTGPANLVDDIDIFWLSRTMGVKENELASRLNVFPNPSNGQFNVSLPAGKAYNLEVTDLTGKVIRTQQANGNTQLKLENTAKGIYLLKVTSEGATTVKKLIVE
jgi:hypothetical protein